MKDEATSSLVFTLGEAHLVASSSEDFALYVDGTLQGRINLADDHLSSPRYVRRLAEGVGAVAAELESYPIIHIGGGLQAVPRLVARMYPTIDQVVFELSSDVIQLTETHVQQDYDLRQVATVNGDGIVEIGMLHSRAAAVVLDVLIDGELPRSVFDTSFIERCHGAMVKSGALAINLHSTCARKHIESIVREVAFHFTYTIATFPQGVDVHTPCNVVLWSSDSSDAIDAIKAISEKCGDDVVPVGRRISPVFLDRFGTIAEETLEQRLSAVDALLSICDEADSFVSELALVRSLLLNKMELGNGN